MSVRKALDFLFVGGFLVALAGASALVLIMWLGSWTDATQALRLSFFGWSLLSLIGLAGLFGGGVLIAGPLRDIKIKAGPVEIGVSGDDKEADAAPE